jgi:3-hydroxybutyryl-CoA dehydrogenase
VEVVSILGTGTMGPGIAAAFANAGHHVALQGRNRARLEAAVARAKEMLAFLSENGLGDPSPDAASSRLEPVLGVEPPTAATVVIEAVSEDLEAKRELFRRLDETCNPGVLLATNTSGLRVSDICRDLRYPGRVVAMHFWNPAHLMPLVEISGSPSISPESVLRATELVASIKKRPVVLRKEVLGFLGTRMQQAVVREAIGLLDAGAASPEDIDAAVRLSFGIRFPVLGPLETTDLSGLDVIRAIHEYLLPDLNSSQRPQLGLTTRVQAGDYGAKSGKGFYDWSKRDPRESMLRRDQELVRRLKQLDLR